MSVDKISLITPIYETSMNFIEDCMISIMQLVHMNTEELEFEWLMIIDGDPRPIESFVDHWQKRYTKIPIKIIRMSDNGGLSMARNVALKSIDTDYVSWLDSDDIIIPTDALPFFSNASKLLNSSDEILFVYSDNIESDEHLAPMNLRKKEVFQTLYEEHHNTWLDPLFYVDFIYQCQLLRLAEVLKVGGFKEGTIGEDVDLVLKLATEFPEKHLSHIPLLPYVYRSNPQGIVHTRYQELRRINSSTYAEYSHRANIHESGTRFEVMYLDEEEGMLRRNLDPKFNMFFNCFLPIEGKVPYYIEH